MSKLSHVVKKLSLRHMLEPVRPEVMLPDRALC